MHLCLRFPLSIQLVYHAQFPNYPWNLLYGCNTYSKQTLYVVSCLVIARFILTLLYSDQASANINKSDFCNVTSICSGRFEWKHDYLITCRHFRLQSRLLWHPWRISVLWFAKSVRCSYEMRGISKFVHWEKTVMLLKRIACEAVRLPWLPR